MRKISSGFGISVLFVWIRRKLSGLSRVEEEERDCVINCFKSTPKKKKKKRWLHCTFSDTTHFLFFFFGSDTKLHAPSVGMLFFTRRWLICNTAVSLGSPLSPTVSFSFSSLFFLVGTHLSITKLLC